MYLILLLIKMEFYLNYLFYLRDILCIYIFVYMIDFKVFNVVFWRIKVNGNRILRFICDI